MTDRTDAELLQAHVAGDADAFGELFGRHRDRFWAVAVRTMGNPEDAADALQDGMISAFRRADSFRGEAAVTTWLHRVMVNACLDRIRPPRFGPPTRCPTTWRTTPVAARAATPPAAVRPTTPAPATYAVRCSPPWQRCPPSSGPR